MGQGQYFEIGTLASALAATEAVSKGQMALTYIPGDAGDGVIQLTLRECGDLEVIVGVAGREIQASVALVPVAQIRDNAVFEHQLLRANKLLPLSTFGITTIGGEDYYEIFGQMSGGSRIEDVLEEIETLGRNALDAAEMIETWTAKPKA